jgi:hypothetical protein
MCVYSMVLDQFGPLIPPFVPDRIWPIGPMDPLTPPSMPSPTLPTAPVWPWGPITPPPQTTPIQLTPAQLQQVLDAFREAMAAAKKADDAVGHANCEDPEKAKLEKRVEELQRELDKMRGKKAKRAKAKRVKR